MRRDAGRWSIADEQTINAVPAAALIPPYVVDPPTGLSLNHQSVTFGTGSSGSGILVTWTPSDDAYVVSTAIQYRSQDHPHGSAHERFRNKIASQGLPLWGRAPTRSRWRPSGRTEHRAPGCPAPSRFESRDSMRIRIESHLTDLDWVAIALFVMGVLIAIHLQTLRHP
jgi:hypothetical protein